MNDPATKVFELQALKAQVEQWQNQGEKVVFTNGCFDLLHRGHIDYLTKTAALGDRLIIGVNSDESVKTLDKGIQRPLQDEESRAIILAALQMVDAVVIFSENTPFNLIKTLQPDVLTKGGDYAIKEIVGNDIVRERGGEVVVIDFLPGYSTTAIEKKILGAKS